MEPSNANEERESETLAKACSSYVRLATGDDAAEDDDENFVDSDSPKEEEEQPDKTEEETEESAGIVGGYIVPGFWGTVSGVALVGSYVGSGVATASSAVANGAVAVSSATVSGVSSLFAGSEENKANEDP